MSLIKPYNNRKSKISFKIYDTNNNRIDIYISYDNYIVIKNGHNKQFRNRAILEHQDIWILNYNNYIIIGQSPNVSFENFLIKYKISDNF